MERKRLVIIICLVAFVLGVSNLVFADKSVNIEQLGGEYSWAGSAEEDEAEAKVVTFSGFGQSVVEPFLTGGKESGHFVPKMPKSVENGQSTDEDFWVADVEVVEIESRAAIDGDKFIEIIFKTFLIEKRTSLFYNTEVFEEVKAIVSPDNGINPKILSKNTTISFGEKSLSWSRTLIIGVIMIIFFLNVTLSKREHPYDEILIFSTVLIFCLITLFLSSSLSWFVIFVMLWFIFFAVVSAYCARNLALYKSHVTLFCLNLFFYLP